MVCFHFNFLRISYMWQHAFPKLIPFNSLPYLSRPISPDFMCGCRFLCKPTEPVWCLHYLHVHRAMDSFQGLHPKENRVTFLAAIIANGS